MKSGRKCWKTTGVLVTYKHHTLGRVPNVQSGGKRWKATGVLVTDLHTHGIVDSVKSGGKRWKTTEVLLTATKMLENDSSVGYR